MGTSGFRSRVDAQDRSSRSYGVDEYVFPSGTSGSPSRQPASERASRISESMICGTWPPRSYFWRASGKLTVHQGRELEQYEHLSPTMRRQTVELITRILCDTGVQHQEEKSLEVIERNGGDDGARTRDLRRDRPKVWTAVYLHSLSSLLVAQVLSRLFSSCYSTCY